MIEDFMGSHVSEYDAVIVGAGIGGIYSAYKLKSLGLTVRLIEKGTQVGGTWFWNRYPGARCDIESVDYSFSFSDELQTQWRWTERYATQDEIQRYLIHVTDRVDLANEIDFSTTVTKATYNEKTQRWSVQTDQSKEYTAQYLILATGILSTPLNPDFPGIDTFDGLILSTANWPTQAIDLSNKRVGVVGTGSSGVQVIPEVAKVAKHLTVFQRTAGYSVPAQNRVLENDEWLAVIGSYDERRQRTRKSSFGAYWSAYELNPLSALAVTEEERQVEYERRWQQGGPGLMVAFADLMTNLEANRTAADFVRSKIRSIVNDPVKAEILCPKESEPLGCKRLTVGTGYYETFNSDHVTLVDVSTDPIIGFSSAGLQCSSQLHKLDAVILATGFDAITGSISKIVVEGVSGTRLGNVWHSGPRNFLGIMMKDFPNLFMINGPLASIANFMISTEEQVNWIARLLVHMQTHGFKSVQPMHAAEEAWVANAEKVMESIVVAGLCNSWINGGNVAGKKGRPIAYMGGLEAYNAECERVESAGYDCLVFGE
jgi:cyclohexanone monooxygenase